MEPATNNKPEKAWRCKACKTEHPVTLYEIEGNYDACPNCREITEHELVEKGAES